MEKTNAGDSNHHNPEDSGKPVDPASIDQVDKERPTDSEGQGQEHRQRQPKRALPHRNLQAFCLRLKRVSIDRKIELLFALVVIMFSGVQLAVTILNNRGNAEQTRQLITAADTQACAAKKNAQAARDFADTADDINSDFQDAVAKLNLQAQATIGLGQAASRQAAAMGAVARTANRIYVASNRPYVAVDRIEVRYKTQVTKDVQKLSSERPARTEDIVGLQFDVTIKNYGAIPADDVVVTRSSLVNDTREGAKTSKVGQLFPNREKYQTVSIDKQRFDAMTSRLARQAVAVNITYRGPAGRYTYCEKETYDPEPGQFAVLDSTCEPFTSR